MTTEEADQGARKLLLLIRLLHSKCAIMSVLASVCCCQSVNRHSDSQILKTLPITDELTHVIYPIYLSDTVTRALVRNCCVPVCVLIHVCKVDIIRVL